MRNAGRRRTRRGSYWPLACAAILCSLGPAATAAAGNPQSLQIRISAGVRTGAGASYTASISNIPPAVQDVAIYAGSPSAAAAVANQTCVRAPGDAWECSFTLTAQEIASRGTSVFALSYPAGAFGAAVRPNGASPAVSVAAAAMPAAPPLLEILPLAFIGIALAGMRLLRERLARL